MNTGAQAPHLIDPDLPLWYKTTCEKHDLDLWQSGKSLMMSWPDV